MIYIDFRNIEGRMCNHFYLCLNAYIKSKEIGKDVSYITNDYFMNNNIMNKLNIFNMGRYPKYNPNINSCDKVYPNNYSPWWKCYHQIFNEDFNYNQLKSFVNDTFISSGRFIKKDNNICGIHLRFGDYVGSQLSNCYDRKKYIKKCINNLPVYIDTLKIFSDDIPMCIEFMKDILNNKKVLFSNNDNDIDDFIELGCLKTKILSNSTFSYWSAFVSNELYKDSFSNIFSPVKFTTIEPDNDHNNPLWNNI